MSTDLHERTTNPSPDPKEPEKPKSSLSFAQVVGGALAAMTAAALGSRLSVAGTLVGAALASVVAAVAGSVYTSSLRRTHARVSSVWQGRSRGAHTAAGAAGAADTAVEAPAAPAAADIQPLSGASSNGSSAGSGTAPTARRRIGWKPVVAGSLLMFAIAAVALTGIELATGQALSGGSGTTISRVADSGSSARPTEPSTPTPSASASSSTSATPSATPTTEPSAVPSPSATAAPSTTTAPSASPSATAVPSSSDVVPGSDATS